MCVRPTPRRGLPCPRPRNPPAAQLVPKHGLLEGIYDTVGMVDAPKFAKAFRSGAVGVSHTRVVGVEADGGVQLSDGSTLQAC
jgi:hypothetical protein